MKLIMYSSLHPEVSGGDSIGVEIVVCALWFNVIPEKEPGFSLGCQRGCFVQLLGIVLPVGEAFIFRGD